MYPGRQWHVKAEEEGEDEEDEEDEFDDEEGEGRHIPPGPQGGSQASVQNAYRQVSFYRHANKPLDKQALAQNSPLPNTPPDPSSPTAKSNPAKFDPRAFTSGTEDRKMIFLYPIAEDDPDEEKSGG